MTAAEIVIDGPHAAMVPIALLTDSRLTTTARTIYGILLWHGMTPERCFPGDARLGELVGIEETSVRRRLSELRDHGWITRHPRLSDSGRRLTDGFTVHSEPRAVTEQICTPARICAQEHRANVHQTGRDTSSRNESNRTPSRAAIRARRSRTGQQPALLTVAGEREGSADAVDEMFAEWWEAYPRKLAKKAAAKAFRSVVKSLGGPRKAEAVLVPGTARWLEHWTTARTAAHHIPYPASWLNGGYYETLPDTETRRRA